MRNGCNERPLQELGVHQLPPVEDVSALSLLVVVIFLEDDAIIMRGIGDLFITLGLLLDLYASSDEHGFHDLAQGLADEAGVVVDQLA